MALIKGNLGEKRSGMKYSIESVPLDIRGKIKNQPKIKWLGESHESADDVMDRQRDTVGRKAAKNLDMIKLLLQKELDEAPGNAILLRDFYALCQKENLGDADKIKKTVQRACREILAVVAKAPNTRGPYWVMLDADAEPWLPKGTTSDERGFAQPLVSVEAL